MLFVLIHGRRCINEAKWSSESGIVVKAILDAIESNRLVVNNSADFTCLIAILFAVHATTLPSVSKLIGSLERTLHMQAS